MSIRRPRPLSRECPPHQGSADPKLAAYAWAYAEQLETRGAGTRRVRLFRNGRNQAFRIPRGFELDTSEAIIRRESERLSVEPCRRGGLLAALSRLEPIGDEFPDTDAGLAPLDTPGLVHDGPLSP